MSAAKLDRVGETRRMNCGLTATIVSYQYCDDIDVQFENGVISRNKTYSSFTKGLIMCPMIYNIMGDYVECINPNTKHETKFIIDIEDLGRVRQKKHWTVCAEGYIQSSNRDKARLHRFIVGAIGNVKVDHKDGNPSNNRKHNLRICTDAQNSFNQRIKTNNTSGYKGATKQSYKDNIKWVARIGYRHDEKYLGRYTCKHTAATIYNQWAIELYGEFARLNVIDKSKCN